MRGNKAFKTAILVSSIFIILALSNLIQLKAASVPSHRLNTGDLGFYLDGDGSRVRFSSNYIYLGNGVNLWSYTGGDTLQFYNLQVGASDVYPSWIVAVSGPANLTISKFFRTV